jgi:hypothetical protein
MLDRTRNCFFSALSARRGPARQAGKRISVENVREEEDRRFTEGKGLSVTRSWI